MELCMYRVNQGWQICGTRAQNGTRHSLLSHLYFISFTRLVSLYCEECLYVHISDWVEIVYELPLLQNNPASEAFLHNSGAVRSVDLIFLTGASGWRWLGEYVALDKTF